MCWSTPGRPRAFGKPFILKPFFPHTWGPVDPLQEPSSIEKVMEIDEHMACAMSGLTADAKTLIDHARAETQSHRFTYNEPMAVESTTQSLCDLALRFGEDSDEGGGMVG